MWNYARHDISSSVYMKTRVTKITNLYKNPRPNIPCADFRLKQCGKSEFWKEHSMMQIKTIMDILLQNCLIKKLISQMPRHCSGLHSVVILLLLWGCLESPMSKLGRGVNKLKLDVFQSNTRSLFQERLTKGDNPFLGSNNPTLDHQVIILHNTIVRETTHRCNVFLSPA